MCDESCDWYSPGQSTCRWKIVIVEAESQVSQVFNNGDVNRIEQENVSVMDRGESNGLKSSSAWVLETSAQSGDLIRRRF